MVDKPRGNALLEAIRRDAIKRGQTRFRVERMDPEWRAPSLDDPVYRFSRCPRFRTMPRYHRPDETGAICVYCQAPIQKDD